MAVLLREALGERLRHVRTGQGRTLREVSTDARVSLGYLSEIERGQKEASSELLAAICDALDVEIADLLLDVGHSLRPADAVVAESLSTDTLAAESLATETLTAETLTAETLTADTLTAEALAAESIADVDTAITATKVVIPAPGGSGAATALAAA